LGALASVVVVLALGMWPAWRRARTPAVGGTPLSPRPSTIVAQLATRGASPSAVIGVRHALQRGYGRGTVPVATALLGTVLAVMALCTTGVFGGSLTHLTATPRLYGDAFQLNFNLVAGHLDPNLLNELEHD